MKLHYYPDTDSLYIELRSSASAETREMAAGSILVNVDAAGAVVGFDIDHASEHPDLSTLKTVALPLRSTKTA